MDLTMMTDLYQLTMANGYFLKEEKEEKMIFDLFFRKNPSNGGIYCRLRDRSGC